MISVCIATYNGEKFIKKQLSSILIQLSEEDEVLISDDGSTDNTLTIIDSFNDSRIKVYKNNFKNVVINFEFIIGKSFGDFIFLSDQDDIWAKNKVEEYMRVFLNDDKTTLVISNLQLIDKDANIIQIEFYKNKFTDKLLSNIKRNNFIGCSMAFRKEVKNIVLPFPRYIAMHDWWIGLCSIIFGKVKFIDKSLIYYRRHANNFTKDVGASLLTKLIWRVTLIFYLFIRIIKFKK
jgi:glycosyltransferase involved in cell wall biosynthesis